MHLVFWILTGLPKALVSLLPDLGADRELAYFGLLLRARVGKVGCCCRARELQSHTDRADEQYYELLRQKQVLLVEKVQSQVDVAYPSMHILVVSRIFSRGDW